MKSSVRSAVGERGLSVADFRVVFVLFGLLVVQALVLMLTPLNLSGDEAYYWEWSHRLDLSYYEKGPGIALLIFLGRQLFGDAEIGVRIPALLCQFFLGLLLYFFASRRYSQSAAYLLLFLFWSSLSFGSLGLFMTGDPPLCLFWMLSLIGAVLAVDRDDSRWWMFSFAAVGCAALFKYSALILIPSFSLLLLLTPNRRRHLWSRGYFCGGALTLLCLAPVIFWNSEHHWINFAENAGHLSGHAHAYGLKHFFELILGQWGLVGPLVFPLAAAALYRGFSAWLRGDRVAGVYVWSALPLAFLCIVVSLKRSVYANWPLPIFIGTLLLIIHLQSSGELQFRKATFRRAVITNFILLLLSYTLFTGYSFGIPARVLPSKMLIGWKGLGEVVETSLSTKQSVNPARSADCHCSEKASFVISEKYMTASEVGFYAPSHPPVYVADPDERHMNQFDIWNGWQNLKGKDAILVFTESDEEEWLDWKDQFCDLAPAEIPSVDIRYGASVLRKFRVYRGCNFSGADLSTFASANDAG